MKIALCRWAVSATMTVCFFIALGAEDALAQGTGPGFGFPSGIAVEPNGNLVVTDRNREAVMHVDPVTGNRSIVTGEGTGMGPGFAQPVAVTLGNNGAVLVADRSIDAVFQVDPVTGNRTVVSGCPESGDPCPVPIVGTGEVFINLEDIAILPDASLVVVDIDRDAVIRVAPITGDRTILSGAATGSGPTLINPVGIVADASGALFGLDASLDAVVRVEVDTGNRTVISGCAQEPDPCPIPPVGLGPELATPVGIAVENSATLVVTDVGLGAVVRIDVVTGDRTIVSDATTGSGPLFLTPGAIAVEPGGALVVADESRRAVLRVDALTGARTLLSKQSELTISPPSGLYASGQSFDLALIMSGVDAIDASRLGVRLDNHDVTASIVPCFVQTSLVGGGAVLQCPAASTLLGLTPGRHVLSIDYPLGPDPAGSDALKNSATWEIVSTQ